MLDTLWVEITTVPSRKLGAAGGIFPLPPANACKKRLCSMSSLSDFPVLGSFCGGNSATVGKNRGGFGETENDPHSARRGRIAWVSERKIVHWRPLAAVHFECNSGHFRKLSPRADALPRVYSDCVFFLPFSIVELAHVLLPPSADVGRPICPGHRGGTAAFGGRRSREPRNGRCPRRHPLVGDVWNGTRDSFRFPRCNLSRGGRRVASPRGSMAAPPTRGCACARSQRERA